MSEVISVMTSKSVETILSDGGTQSWALDRNRAARCDYVVMCRNAKAREMRGSEAHGTAFMVGKVKDVVASTETPNRWLILIREYALTNVPDQWSGRNPVSYWSERDFPDIDFSGLAYQAIAASKPLGLTIAEAKAGLAVTFNVPEAAIEITIRG